VLCQPRRASLGEPLEQARKNETGASDGIALTQHDVGGEVSGGSSVEERGCVSCEFVEEQSGEPSVAVNTTNASDVQELDNSTSVNIAKRRGSSSTSTYDDTETTSTRSAGLLIAYSSEMSDNRPDSSGIDR
jgi:hypothetical protein